MPHNYKLSLKYKCLSDATSLNLGLHLWWGSSKCVVCTIDTCIAYNAAGACSSNRRWNWKWLTNCIIDDLKLVSTRWERLKGLKRGGASTKQSSSSTTWLKPNSKIGTCELKTAKLTGSIWVQENRLSRTRPWCTLNIIDSRWGRRRKRNSNSVC